MKDLSAKSFILGMEIKIDRARKRLWSNQSEYANIILHGFNMKECKLVKVTILVGENLSSY